MTHRASSLFIWLNPTKCRTEVAKIEICLYNEVYVQKLGRAIFILSFPQNLASQPTNISELQVKLVYEKAIDIYHSITLKKTHPLWVHPTSYSSISSLHQSISALKETMHLNTHWERFLAWWPWPLTYELDLDILPFDLNAKIQVCMSVRSAVRVRQTHTHNFKTITPDTSQTWDNSDEYWTTTTTTCLFKELILSATYLVVLFDLTIKWYIITLKIRQIQWIHRFWTY